MDLLHAGNGGGDLAGGGLFLAEESVGIPVKGGESLVRLVLGGSKLRECRARSKQCNDCECRVHA